MKTNYEKRHRNNYYDFLLLWAVLPVAIFLSYGKIDYSHTMLWMGLMAGGFYYLMKLNKPENVYHIKTESTEQKIKKAEYEKGIKEVGAR